LRNSNSFAVSEAGIPVSFASKAMKRPHFFDHEINFLAVFGSASKKEVDTDG